MHIDRGYILPLYLIGVDLAVFAAMGIDKRRAKERRGRIPEKAMFLLPLLGGSVGGGVEMYLFRHKTRHWYFRYGCIACWFGNESLLSLRRISLHI